jgi:hypothetical protein
MKPNEAQMRAIMTTAGQNRGLNDEHMDHEDKVMHSCPSCGEMYACDAEEGKDSEEVTPEQKAGLDGAHFDRE